MRICKGIFYINYNKKLEIFIIIKALYPNTYTLYKNIVF